MWAITIGGLWNGYGNESTKNKFLVQKFTITNGLSEATTLLTESCTEEYIHMYCVFMMRCGKARRASKIDTRLFGVPAICFRLLSASVLGRERGHMSVNDRMPWLVRRRRGKSCIIFRSKINFEVYFWTRIKFISNLTIFFEVRTSVSEHNLKMRWS